MSKNDEIAEAFIRSCEAETGKQISADKVETLSGLLSNATDYALPPSRDMRPQRGNWAPGLYACICRHCETEFAGDKRATICAECAYGETGDETSEILAGLRTTQIIQLSADDLIKIRAEAEALGRQAGLIEAAEIAEDFDWRGMGALDAYQVPSMISERLRARANAEQGREMSAVKKKTLALVAEIDADELAVKLMIIGIRAHPTAKEKCSNREIIQAAKGNWPPSCGPFPFDLMAHAAIEYMAGCIKNGRQPS